MKLTIDEVKNLITTRLFLLKEDEVKALAFLLNLEVSKYKKMKTQLSFMVQIGTFSALVVAYSDTNTSMGKRATSMVSWGGCHSFADMVSIFRTFFCQGRYELMIQSREALKIYEKDEWQDLVLTANDLVENRNS